MKNKMFLRAKSAFFAFALCVFSFTVVTIAAPFDKFAESNSSANAFAGVEQTEVEIFDMVNEQRRRMGLDELQWDGELAQLAREYSRTMARGNFFDHYEPDGGSVVERAQNAHIKKWSKIGENLFYCEGVDEFSRVAVKGWMKSPTHKENILDRDWNYSGIGVYAARGGRIYITQVFIER